MPVTAPASAVGARRIGYELGRRGVDRVPSRATVHRVLTRNGLIDAQAQQHRRQYKRWQRQTPMHLWQLDIVGGVPLADGRECKLVTGIDDHSRFVVAATVVPAPSGRAVCEAFTEAMRRYGVPSEVLTDNGGQFTGRHNRPQPVEVLFERICRENGITQRRTKPRSPTTTGKIERFHRTLREEFLNHVAPFESPSAAQEAVDAWVSGYNQQRPHQALDMATPASLFRPNGPTRQDKPPENRHLIGFAWAGRRVALRLDGHLMHAVLDNALIGTWPCPISTSQLAQLKGARSPATQLPPPPLPAGSLRAQRKVHANGRIMVAKQSIKLGPRHAGKLVTVIVEDTHLRVIHGEEEIAVRPRRSLAPITRFHVTGAGAKVETG